MLNDRRVYLMTQIAIFEKNHKSQLDGVEKCFRSDYIGRHMIKNSFRITLAYLLILAGWVLYHAETLVIDITQIDVRALGARVLFLYVVVMSVFLVVTYSIQSVRYSRAKQDLYQYRDLLQKLEKMYENEDRA